MWFLGWGLLDPLHKPRGVAPDRSCRIDQPLPKAPPSRQDLMGLAGTLLALYVLVIAVGWLTH